MAEQDFWNPEPDATNDAGAPRTIHRGPLTSSAGRASPSVRSIDSTTSAPTPDPG